jgi:D-alanyl-D-alanine carboxypeptidase/D-alanyl-D-alanine-endopeptidase (penicillin-binding protein 4)
VKVKNLADVLQKAYEDNQLHQDFISSLSVLGVDGTLKRKFRGKELEGMFVGKTGTLNGVTALSGYVFRRSAPDRPPFIFSFIANGAGKMFWQQRQLQEKILELLINQ